MVCVGIMEPMLQDAEAHANEYKTNLGSSFLAMYIRKYFLSFYKIAVYY